MDGKIDAAVSNNDIIAFAKCRNDGGDGAERLRVNYRRFRTQESCNVTFEFHVQILAGT